jgi:predicted house-cleaning NTP pyrophosphatase (Maf/HAM1 superfamily)
MSDIQEEQKRLYKRAEENDKENLKYMSTEEALNQIKQRIMMHKLDNTTSNENEREKVILNYINELQDRIDKATDYIEQNTWEDDYGCFVIDDEKGILLNILKGDNK